MTILITGATGTVGSKTVSSLAALGVKAVSGVRTPKGAGSVHADLDDANSLNRAFEGVKRLLLITPFVESFEPQVTRALSAAKRAGVEHVVRLSAAGASPDAGMELARQHGRADEALKASGMGWTIVKPLFFQDNFVKFQADTIKKDGAFYGASKGGRSAYISSRDIGEVLAKVLQDPAPHAGKTLDLTGPEALSDSQAADIIGQALGKTVRYVDLEPEQLEAGLRSSGTPDWMVDGLIALEAVKANGWAAEVSPVVQSVLGKEGQRFADFIAENVSAFR